MHGPSPSPRVRALVAFGLFALPPTSAWATAADRAPTCSARQQRWLNAAPASTLEHVFGVGTGADYTYALAQSRVRAAEAFGIEVRSVTTDRQALEQGPQGTREHSSFEMLDETRVKRVLEGCQVLESCRDSSDRTLHVLTRCSRKSHAERDAEDRAELARLPICDAARSWSSAPKPMTTELIFGVGVGRSLEAAEASAKVRAAETLGIEVRAKTSDRQVLWQRNGVTTDSSEFEQVADTFVARRLEGCQVSDQCRDLAGGIANASVLVQCFRRSPFERQLERMGAAIGPKLPKEARILVVPGTDRSGAITALGELGTTLLRSAADATLPVGAAFVRTPAWEPVALHEVARRVGATHLLRFEYALHGERRVQNEVWLQRAEDDLNVPGTAASSIVDLDDSALTLLEAKGPLLPQKDALSVAADLAPRRLDSKVPGRIEEGSEVEMEFTIDKPGYLYVFSMDEAGAVTMLRPVADAPDARVSPGKLRFPDVDFRRAVGAGITACGIAGRKVSRENVKAVLTSKPLELPAWSPGQPVLEFSATRGTPVSALLEALNKQKRIGAILADSTNPYLIETGSRGRGPCP